MRKLSLGVAGVFIALLACTEKSPTQPAPPVACAFTLSASTLTFGPAGGSESVTVTTTASCAWAAASDRGWMTIGSGASGTGSGAVSVSVAANASPSVRAGTLTIAGQAVAVTQQGAQEEPCVVTLSPSSASFSKDAGTGSVTVTAPASCAWTASSTAAWLTISPPSSGRGSGVVAYSVARNTVTGGRTASITAGTATHTVSQAGDLGACEYQVAPVEINACMSVPFDLTTTVTTQSGCGWTVTSDASWLSPSGGASRAGSGEVRFRVGDNYDAPRAAVLKLRWDAPTAGQNVRVAQAGCRYAVSAASLSVPPDGGTFSFDVYQQSDPLECGGALQDRCVWTAAAGASWIAITTAMPRAGDDRVTFTVSPNPGPARSARITVRDKAVDIVQGMRFD